MAWGLLFWSVFYLWGNRGQKCWFLTFWNKSSQGRPSGASGGAQEEAQRPKMSFFARFASNLVCRPILACKVTSCIDIWQFWIFMVPRVDPGRGGWFRRGPDAKNIIFCPICFKFSLLPYFSMQSKNLHQYLTILNISRVDPGWAQGEPKVGPKAWFTSNLICRLSVACQVRSCINTWHF